MLSNLCLPSDHQGDTSTIEYWSGKGLTSTILRDSVETRGDNQKDKKDEGSSSNGGVMGTVVPVVVVVLVLIVGAIAGVIFWRR